jgi:hypothetical protein
MDMPELTEMQPQRTAGFVDPHHNNNKANRKRIEAQEKELEELMSGTEEEVSEVKEEVEEDDSHLSREEKSFKKRYGDVRRYLGEKEKEWQDKYEALEGRLKGSSFVPPKSDEDIAAWAEKYPDVAGIVETIAAKKAQEMFSKAESRLEQIDQAAYEAVRVKAENKIRESHPDFDKLRQADEFHDWVDEQPKWVQNALYENADDAASVVRILDLYKGDKGLTKNDYAAKRKAAASTVSKGSRANIDADNVSGTIRESEVAKMSDKEFEKRADEINVAMRTGKFVYDISGSAR